MNHEQKVYTAYHEAGHAVVSVKLYLKFLYVTIKPTDADCWGHVKYPPTPKRISDCLLHIGCPKSRARDRETREFYENHAISSFAGRDALEDHLRHTVEQGHEDDYEKARKGIAEVGGDKIPPHTGQIPPHIQEYCSQWLRARSKHLVEFYRNEIDAVAQALIKRERLTWQDVLRIMDDAAQVTQS